MKRNDTERNRMDQNQKEPQHRMSFDAFYPHSPERVWRALIDPAALARWLMPTDFRPRLGHRFQFRDRSGRGKSQILRAETILCEVVALDAPRRLAYTWQSERDQEPTLVTWTLEPVDGGTRLQLVHTVCSGPQTLIFRMQAGANWQAALNVGLPTALDLAWSRPRRLGLILLPNASETVRCVSRYRLPPLSKTRKTPSSL
jgi:uncharacterized protein YndB with AHSA1/START domain